MEQSALEAPLCNGGVCMMDRTKPGALNTLKHQLNEFSTQSSDRTSCTAAYSRTHAAAITRTLQHRPVMEHLELLQRKSSYDNFLLGLFDSCAETLQLH